MKKATLNFSIAKKGVETHQKKRVKLNNRVALLGDMDDRRKAYLGERDKSSLLTLASEYDSLGMVTTAAQVRHEAGNL